MRSYYSVIQYCPDRSRLEVVNIGLLLFSPDHRMRCKISDNNNRVAQFFGRDSFVEEHLNMAKQAVVFRLQKIAEERDHNLFFDFIETRANDIVLTTPRSANLVDINQDFESMFKELVL